MYLPTKWLDHVTEFPNRRVITDNGDGTQTVEKAQGEIIQQGTPQSATNFNNMETGIFDANIAVSLFMNFARQLGWRTDALEKATVQEVGTVTLTNSLSFPFNNSKASVALTNRRDNLNYIVVIVAVTGTGNIGEVDVTDRLVNGFKLAYSGSAPSATVTYAVIGGYDK